MVDDPLQLKLVVVLQQEAGGTQNDDSLTGICAVYFTTSSSSRRSERVSISAWPATVDALSRRKFLLASLLCDGRQSRPAASSNANPQASPVSKGLSRPSLPAVFVISSA